MESACLPDGTPLYIPFTLPGETVTARALQSRGDGWHAFAEAISQASEARVEPPCRHFWPLWRMCAAALAG